MAGPTYGFGEDEVRRIVDVVRRTETQPRTGGAAPLVKKERMVREANCQIVRVTGAAAVGGLYPAFVQTYLAQSDAWSDSAACWARDPGGAVLAAGYFPARRWGVNPTDSSGGLVYGVVAPAAAVSPVLFFATASKSFNGVTSLSSIVPTGTGSLSIAANTLAIGSYLRVHAGGSATLAASASVQLLPEFPVNNGDIYLVNSSAGSISCAWLIEQHVVCRTTGTSGVLAVTTGCMAKVISGSTANLILEYQAAPATVPIDTTIANAFDLLNTNNAAADFCQCDVYVLEKVR